jgi:hypothetical protein
MTSREIVYEFLLYDITKRKLNPQKPDPDKLVAELNELGNEGWSVVATFATQYGITSQLRLQRDRR